MTLPVSEEEGEEPFLKKQYPSHKKSIGKMNWSH